MAGNGLHTRRPSPRRCRRSASRGWCSRFTTPAFPPAPTTSGRGTPYSDAGRALFGFARALGFTGVQLGPQGLTSRDNPSPYDAMLFSREPLSIHAAPLLGRDAWQRARRRRAVDDGAPRRSSRRVRSADARARGAVARAARRVEPRRRRVGASRSASGSSATRRIGRDAARRNIASCSGSRTSSTTSCARTLRAARAVAVGRSADRRVVARSPDAGAAVPRRLRDGRAAEPHQSRGPAVGLSGARSGAVRRRGAARWSCARVGKMLAEYDGAAHRSSARPRRYPWVYRTGAARSASGGARRRAAVLVAGPARSSARWRAFAIARPEQLDRGELRWADGWVRALDDAQVDRYAPLFDASSIARARAGRIARDDLLCEVLSTLAVSAPARDGARGARPAVRDAEGEPRRRARRLSQRERARRRLDHGRQPRHAADCGRSSTHGTARRRRRGARSTSPSGSSRTRARAPRSPSRCARRPGGWRRRCSPSCSRRRPNRCRSSSPTCSAIARPTTRRAR